MSSQLSRPDICGDQHLVPKAIERDYRTSVDLDSDNEVPLGLAYHGELDHREAERLLDGMESGCFLVRRSGSSKGYFTLSVRFNGRTKHFRLFYAKDSGQFYLKQHYKHFDSVNALVEDGLRNYHLEQVHGKDGPPPRTPTSTSSKESLIAEPKEEIQEKATIKVHVFKIHTFRGLNWCEVCAQFLWGFSVQGIKCENCSFVAHKRCADSVAKQECPGEKNESKGPLFGIELNTVMKNQSNSIPFLVVKCVEEIEARGIMQEGIYRVSGFADEVDELKENFEKNGRRTNISTENISIHTVAGVLKMFFRNLPTPLITTECGEQLMKCLDSDEEEKQLKSIKTTLLTLSTPHWNCLKYMANHLRRVGTYHEQNKMNETNLATVFAPTLIGSNLKQFTDLSREIILLAFIIRHCTILFS